MWRWAVRPWRSTMLDEQEQFECTLGLLDDGTLVLTSRAPGEEGAGEYSVRVAAEYGQGIDFDKFVDYLSAGNAPVWTFVTWLRANGIPYQTEISQLQRQP